MTAVNSFRVLYQEFWKEAEVSRARRIIISDIEYSKKLMPILIKRNRTKTNKLTEREHEILDNIDRFLSVLVRIKSFNISGEIKYIDDLQKNLWDKILNATFFINFIEEHREELYCYIWRTWKKELIDTMGKEMRRPDPSCILESDSDESLAARVATDSN